MQSARSRSASVPGVRLRSLDVRADLAIAVVGNSIYAIGGRTSTGGPCTGGPLATVERYDIASDTWTPVASLLAPRSDLAAATVGGKTYVFGGCDAAGNFPADVDVYNPVTDTWSAAPANMPIARAGMYAVARQEARELPWHLSEWATCGWRPCRSLSSWVHHGNPGLDGAGRPP